MCRDKHLYIMLIYKTYIIYILILYIKYSHFVIKYQKWYLNPYHYHNKKRKHFYVNLRDRDSSKFLNIYTSTVLKFYNNK